MRYFVVLNVTTSSYGNNGDSVLFSVALIGFWLLWFLKYIHVDESVLL